MLLPRTPVNRGRPSPGRGPGGLPRSQINQRPSLISSRSGSSFASRQAWMRRGEMRNQRYGAASARVEAGARDEPLTALLRQRVDLEDLDFAIDHGHVAGVAQRQPNGPAGGQVPAGRAVRRRGHQQRLAVPVEGQRHQVGRAVRRGAGHPEIDVVGEPILGVAATPGAGLGSRAQLAALFTSAPIFASSAAASSFSANEVGHMAPSSSFAASLKPSVAYRASNFSALWK